jgi:hypothetical protein
MGLLFGKRRGWSAVDIAYKVLHMQVRTKYRWREGRRKVKGHKGRGGGKDECKKRSKRTFKIKRYARRGEECLGRGRR